MSEKPFPDLVEACETLFAEHGDTYRGVGWTKSQDNADRRYDVMIGLMAGGHRPATLLDLGCGTGHLLGRLRACSIGDIAYTGLDVSERLVEVARAKYPEITFHLGELETLDLPTFDYVVMNGLFTYKGSLSFDDMVIGWQRVVTSAMTHADVGVAFNVTSPYVDWERDDLFHVPVSILTDFVAASACPHFVVRNDYELFETTVYAYRAPRNG